MLQRITIERIEMGLEDLLTKRSAALESFKYGAFIKPELSELGAKLAALPAAAKKKPFAGELGALDKDHDGYGAACWYLVQAYLRAPDTTSAQRESLEKIRDYLGPLDDITASYEAEAGAARDRKPKLADFETALSAFPVADQKTLFDWATGYIDAGLSIGQTLSERADAKDRETANVLRSDLVGTLNETRRQLRREQKKNPSLPADLEAQVFAWLDDLEKSSAQEAAAEKKAAEEEAKKAAEEEEAKKAAEEEAKKAAEEEAKKAAGSEGEAGSSGEVGPAGEAGEAGKGGGGS